MVLPGLTRLIVFIFVLRQKIITEGMDMKPCIPLKQCVTETGKACLFPFRVPIGRGRSQYFTGCTNMYDSQISCAVEVDNEGFALKREPCSEKCIMGYLEDSGKNLTGGCEFCFQYKGVTHCGCTDAKQKFNFRRNLVWCATRVTPDVDRKMQSWKSCGPICPITFTVKPAPAVTKPPKGVSKIPLEGNMTEGILFEGSTSKKPLNFNDSLTTTATEASISITTELIEEYTDEPSVTSATPETEGSVTDNVTEVTLTPAEVGTTEAFIPSTTDIDEITVLTSTESNSIVVTPISSTQIANRKRCSRV